MLFDPEAGAMTSGSDYEATAEGTSFIIECAMLDVLSESEINDFLADPREASTAVSEGTIHAKTIVRMGKQARQNNMYKSAIFVIAKEKNDTKYKKLVNVWRMERNLEAELEKKYGAEAQRRSKKAMADMRKSGSYTLKKVGNEAKVAPTTTFKSGGTGVEISAAKKKAAKK